MDNSLLRTYIRQLIIEAKEAKAKKTVSKTGKPELKTKKKITVSDHIKMIEEAGEEAGKQAKTAEIEKIMDAINHIKSTIDGLEHFDKVVGASTVKSLTTDLENSLKELTKKKEELTKQAKSKEMTDLVSETEQKKMVGETIGIKNFIYKDSTGKEKFITADNIAQAEKKVKEFGADPKTVKEKTAALPVAPKKR